jgi:hypothetical protein
MHGRCGARDQPGKATSDAGLRDLQFPRLGWPYQRERHLARRQPDGHTDPQRFSRLPNWERKINRSRRSR